MIINQLFKLFILGKLIQIIRYYLYKLVYLYTLIYNFKDPTVTVSVLRKPFRLPVP